MDQKISQLIEEVKEASANPEFIHHKWFVKYHLELVEKISLELLKFYPEADRDTVILLVWLHDYGKIIDFDKQYEINLEVARQLLEKLEFPKELTEKIVEYIEIFEKKMEIDFKKAAIEIQIVSSADGASHLIGPFYKLYWYENPNKDFEELMKGNLAKLNKDWERKVVIPEVREAVKSRYQMYIADSQTELGRYQEYIEDLFSK